MYVEPVMNKKFKCQNCFFKDPVHKGLAICVKKIGLLPYPVCVNITHLPPGSAITALCDGCHCWLKRSCTRDLLSKCKIRNESSQGLGSKIGPTSQNYILASHYKKICLPWSMLPNFNLSRPIATTIVDRLKSLTVCCT